MKEKKSAAANVHCLCQRAHSVSQNRGKIILAGNGMGMKSSAARMTKKSMTRMFFRTVSYLWLPKEELLLVGVFNKTLIAFGQVAHDCVVALLQDALYFFWTLTLRNNGSMDNES